MRYKQLMVCDAELAATCLLKSTSFRWAILTSKVGHNDLILYAIRVH